MPLDGLLETEVDEIVKIRQDMADWLEQNDWLRQAWHCLGKPASCWVGSFYRVRGPQDWVARRAAFNQGYDTIGTVNDETLAELHQLARRVFASMGFSAIGYAIDWNDAKERTKAEVIAKLRGV